MTFCIDSAQNPLIIDSDSHCSIVAKDYMDNHFPNWEKQLFPTKAKDFESESGKMKSIGKIIKEIIITHRKGNIRLNPEFVGLMISIYKDSYWEQTTKGCMALTFSTVRTGTLP
ncbi:hypothetical protein O181_020764 [Austropuccinia psidii MF-1]|uniref:Uncharacterized protein n=1 Tax=Austropuccinia psidii MF-1 TaxID=1389203 RepID=A0A9Q3C9I6_9BASI|nr:hypothetical protein [Austropuccinia psidii MF-1]